MKKKSFILIGVMGLALATMSLRADSSSNNDNSPRDRDAAQAEQSQAQSLDDLRRATTIIGAEVRDEQNNKRIGKIKDLGFDLKNGRVVAVILATGGTAGFEEKMKAVPPESLTCDRSQKDYRLKNSAKLNEAPDFDLANWEKSTSTEQVWEIYQRFSVEPYFAHEAPPQATKPDDAFPAQTTHNFSFNGQNALPRLAYLVRATKLMGSTTWNTEGKKLAKVNNFIIDLPKGRLVEVVLAYGGFWGMGVDYTAVPPQAFTLSTDHSVIGLDSSRDALKAAPHFSPANAKEETQPQQIEQVYSLYRVSPYFMMHDLNQNGGAENVRERTDEQNSSSPLSDQKANGADMQITDQIHKAILSDNTLAADAREVKIVTANGKVTLIGPVATEQEKKQIGEDAAKLVSSDKVDNQLEVLPKNTAPANSTTTPPPSTLPGTQPPPNP